MNCCTDFGICQKGINCPIRAQEAKVARVGRKDYAREELPPSVWRIYLRHLAKWMLIAIVILMWMPLVMSFALAKAKEPPAMACAGRISFDTQPAHIVIKCGKGQTNG